MFAFIADRLDEKVVEADFQKGKSFTHPLKVVNEAVITLIRVCTQYAGG